MTTTVTTESFRAIVNTMRAFRALPPTALPSIMWRYPTGTELCEAREVPRAILEGDEVIVALAAGESIRLRADADGWRDGVTVEIPEVSPEFGSLLRAMQARGR